jgi:dienelactone hydrolase
VRSSPDGRYFATNGGPAVQLRETASGRQALSYPQPDTGRMAPICRRPTLPQDYIRDAKAPLLVLQGDNDIRVPKEEAEQVVKTLKDAGKTVDAHYYANEGHGFAKRKNQIDAIQRTIEWFDRYLKGSMK